LQQLVPLDLNDLNDLNDLHDRLYHEQIFP
jgi:hypothetical protein